MQTGVFLLAGRFPGQSEQAALDRAVDCALAAEETGFDDVWIAEHHFIPYGLCPSAVTFAGHLLGRTSRIAVGTACAVLSTQHPVALAEQAALLDRLSGGRLRLGVGRGGPWVDLEVFGSGLERYEQGFAEALDLLLRWLSSGRVAADGRWFRFREVTVTPRPATMPYPPVVVACTSEATVDLAAARGLPVLLGMDLTDERRRALLERWAAEAARHGHDPHEGGHVACVLAQVGESRAEAEATLRARMLPFLEEGVGAYTSIAPGARRRRDLATYLEHLLEISALGTPQQCAERLAGIAERCGTDHLILMVEGAGDHGRVLDNVARLGAETLPLLRSPVPSG